MMLDELQRRNYSQSTARTYIHAVEDFAKYFHRSPERLGPEHIRQYQAYLFRERKLSPGTIEGRTAALRFLFIKTLRRPYLPDHIPFLWHNGVHVDDASFAGCGRGYAGCGLTSAWFRSGWGRFDGRRGGGAHQGQGGDSVDDGDGGPDCCRVAGGAGEGDRDDDDGEAWG